MLYEALSEMCQASTEPERSVKEIGTWSATGWNWLREWKTESRSELLK